jgi:hypothetical protein
MRNFLLLNSIHAHILFENSQAIEDDVLTSSNSNPFEKYLNN